VNLRVENSRSPFTASLQKGTILRVPIAHGEGCYTADTETLAKLNANGQVLLRYCDETGAVTAAANPNGSAESIAGICNEAGNVFGLMPHPERACDPLLGSIDGAPILRSLANLTNLS
jgi:phosphoribosylformylglycinamidine synthase